MAKRDISELDKLDEIADKIEELEKLKESNVFANIVAKNLKNKRRLAEERAKANKQVLDDYMIKEGKK